MVGLTSKLPPEQLLAEVDELLRTMPAWSDLHDPQVEWFGRAAAVVAAWDGVQSVSFDAAVRTIQSGWLQEFDQATAVVQTILNRARFDLRLHTPDAGTRVLHRGEQFSYFDEVRKIIERARSDLLFVDPYLGADFVSRYVPYVQEGVNVRLLGREKIGQLVSAVDMMRAQRPGLSIEVRSVSGFHDRWLFLDGREAFQSGASFHDGARLAPTTLTPLTDAFAVMQQTYQRLWDSGTVK